MNTLIFFGTLFLLVVYMNIGYGIGCYKYNIYVTRETQPRWKLFLLWPFVSAEKDKSKWVCGPSAPDTKESYARTMSIAWIFSIFWNIVFCLIFLLFVSGAKAGSSLTENVIRLFTWPIRKLIEKK